MRLPIVLIRFCRIARATGCCGLALSAIQAQAQSLKACADGAEMPPFVFSQAKDKSSTKPAQTELLGVSVDLLNQIAREHGWRIQVQLLPWARCLLDLANNEVQIAINVRQGEAAAGRPAPLLSAPFFTTHSIYFYSRRAHPQNLHIDSPSDLQGLQVCGVGGYRYDMFGIDSAKVDLMVARSYTQLVAMLHLGRCDLGIDSREALAGLFLTNPKLRAELSDRTLVMEPLPGAPLNQLHFGVSPKAAHAQALLLAINTSLKRIDKTNEVERLINAYLK